MKKTFRTLALFLLVFLFTLFFHPSFVRAGTGDNVTGWAWSSNIGWISFNNTTDGGATDYGVNIDSTTGNMTGYAWSENIGWIHFNPASPFPVGAGTLPHSARLDFQDCPNGKCPVSGWARACAVFDVGCSGDLDPNRGGWDGWISLRGVAPNYGVYIDNTTRQFEGWAWGGDSPNEEAVIGWISFNCADQNVCTTSDYKVATTFLFNSPPEATELTSVVEYCDHGHRFLVEEGTSVNLSWHFHDDDGDSQQEYEINVTGSGVDFTATGTTAIERFLNVSLDFNTTYNWSVRVNDGKVWSEWSAMNNFTIARTHASPRVKLSHSPKRISIDEVITFQTWDYNALGHRVDSQVYDGSDPTFKWTFVGGNPIATTTITTTSTITTTTFDHVGPWTATLEVIDSKYSCSKTQNINIGLPLPEWEEISPFGRIRTFLASVINRIRKRVAVL